MAVEELAIDTTKQTKLVAFAKNSSTQRETRKQNGPRSKVQTVALFCEVFISEKEVLSLTALAHCSFGADCLERATLNAVEAKTAHDQDEDRIGEEPPVAFGKDAQGRSNAHQVGCLWQNSLCEPFACKNFYMRFFYLDLPRLLGLPCN